MTERPVPDAEAETDAEAAAATGAATDVEAAASVDDADPRAALDGGRGSGDAPSESDAPPLELRGVSKVYDSATERVVALDSVDFRVEAGEFVAVVGPSGSGKSTMLHVLGLLDSPTSGVVRLQGRDVTTLDDRALTDARRESIGFVFQDFFLVPTLTAVENVELPALFTPARGAPERARALLGRVGLEARLDHRPDQLSGGQKQRVAIARALVNDPGVVLADEPTGNLDRDTGKAVLGEFRRVCETGVGVVAVTHDPLVTAFADRTVRLVDGRLDDDAVPLERVVETPSAPADGDRTTDGDRRDRTTDGDRTTDEDGEQP